MIIKYCWNECLYSILKVGYSTEEIFIENKQKNGRGTGILKCSPNFQVKLYIKVLFHDADTRIYMYYSLRGIKRIQTAFIFWQFLHLS